MNICGGGEKSGCPGGLVVEGCVEAIAIVPKSVDGPTFSMTDTGCSSLVGLLARALHTLRTCLSLVRS